MKKEARSWDVKCPFITTLVSYRCMPQIIRQVHGKLDIIKAVHAIHKLGCDKQGRIQDFSEGGA